ncbi:MAG: T9SS type A sorting domain-containing protein [Bacteroidales bacterium]|nr:T9SS type A sorting domain-containing protein [Bacteroidales bacterium]
MKTILIVFVALTAMTNVLGQSVLKKVDKRNFKNIVNHGISFHKVASSGDYSFSTTTGTYSNLSNAISINNNQLWDDPEDSIPVGFNFKLYDLVLDTVYLGIGYGGLVSSVIDTNFEADYLVLPFETDLIDRGNISGISQSPISYKLEGASGNRILKVEWNNAGFYDEGELLGTLHDYINFQLWLYEGSNDIEIHFGPNMITNPLINYGQETGAIIGLSDYNLINPYLLSGNPVNPVLSDTLVFLGGTPADGTIYKFSNLTSGIKNNQPGNFDVQIYPNPAHQIAIVRVNNGKLNHAELRITDTFGRTIKAIRDIQTNEISVDCNNLIKGIYLYQLTDQGKNVATGKLIIE